MRNGDNVHRFKIFCLAIAVRPPYNFLVHLRDHFKKTDKLTGWQDRLKFFEKEHRVSDEQSIRFLSVVCVQGS